MEYFMSRRTTIIIAVLLIIAAGAIWGYREFTRVPANLTELDADHTVDAISLIKEFTTNDTLADQKYRNAILAVQGQVKAIDSSGSQYTVVMGDTSDLSSVRCSMDSKHFASLGSPLQRGQSITIKGAITGFTKDETGLLGSDVELNRCVVQQ